MTGERVPPVVGRGSARAAEAARGEPRPGAGTGPRAATREAIAHAFLAEYHRLLADALAEVLPGEPAPAGGDDPGDVGLRRRAFAWRVTAARIPLVPGRCWPAWLLEHLHAAAETPVLGPEYRRQHALLVELLAGGAPGGHRPA